MDSYPPFSISLLSDRLYFLSPANAKFCKNLLIPFSTASSPTLFFPSSNSTSLSGCPILPLKPLLCRAASAADTDTLPKSAIKRIADKLRSLGYGETDDRDKGSPPPEINNDTEDDTHGYSPGEIFVPLPIQLPKYRVGHTLDPSWSTPENPVPLPGAGKAIQNYHQLRVGAIRERMEQRSKPKKEKVPTLAELTLPKKELRRLMALGIALQRRLKVGKAGITEGIVNAIHERWRRNEVVKIKCEDICSMNMKRTHDLLERKTGGLVVWRSGTIIVLYRGAGYRFPYFSCYDDYSTNDTANGDSPVDELMDLNGEHACKSDGNAGASAVVQTLGDGSHPSLIRGVGSPNIVRFQLPGEAQLAEEADRMLEGLGPRFTDWWGYEPLPIDADLLPAVVPGYRRPFRLLPYGVKPILTNDEMTILKRLGRPLPCHFALGRNRRHQGLAAAIIKLWEKCEIAKISIKRGFQNTNSELMAEELKRLTGGTLLSRDKEFIVLYRGKDFLPAAVSSAIEERRKYVLDIGRQGEVKDSCTGNSNDNIQSTSEYDSKDENTDTGDQKSQIVPELRLLRKTEATIEKTSAKLSKALTKKAAAEKLLADLEEEETSQEPEIDKEGITEEERYMLRKVGLRMGPFLLLGRRGVFDGTIENMHLHWKYRELVKIITGGKNIKEIHGIARTLEAESGGILVAVERVSKGYAIIVYRGKNYSRPACLRPRSLLSKRAALKRSIEAQRRESLKLYVLKLSQHIDDLELQLAKDNDANKMLLDKELRPELDKEQKIMKLQSAESEKPVASPDVCLSGGPSSQLRLGQTSASLISGAGAALDDTIAPLSIPASPKIESDSLVREDRMSGNTTLPFGAKSLSNKERLLLRNRALMLKKRPLFAIGKSNKIRGVGEAIKAHFQKHPLAIVNVKGRAKGTSVQEVVFKLEQATGGVLVSREPSKVILYRGWWGAGEAEEEEEATHGHQKRSTDLRLSAEKDGRTWNAVSEELVCAIRLECGLQS